MSSSCRSWFPSPASGTPRMASMLTLSARLHRKFPQFPQNEIFSLSDAFQRLDVDDKGYLDEATAIKATQQSESQPYDVVRQALKEVELDSSRRVELEDYVGVSRQPCPSPVAITSTYAHPRSSSPSFAMHLLPKSACPPARRNLPAGASSRSVLAAISPRVV